MPRLNNHSFWSTVFIRWQAIVKTIVVLAIAGGFIVLILAIGSREPIPSASETERPNWDSGAEKEQSTASATDESVANKISGSESVSPVDDDSAKSESAKRTELEEATSDHSSQLTPEFQGILRSGTRGKFLVETSAGVIRPIGVKELFYLAKGQTIGDDGVDRKLFVEVVNPMISTVLPFHPHEYAASIRNTMVSVSIEITEKELNGADLSLWGTNVSGELLFPETQSIVLKTQPLFDTESDSPESRQRLSQLIALRRWWLFVEGTLLPEHLYWHSDDWDKKGAAARIAQIHTRSSKGLILVANRCLISLEGSIDEDRVWMKPKHFCIVVQDHVGVFWLTYCDLAGRLTHRAPPVEFPSSS